MKSWMHWLWRSLWLKSGMIMIFSYLIKILELFNNYCFFFFSFINTKFYFYDDYNTLKNSCYMYSCYMLLSKNYFSISKYDFLIQWKASHDMGNLNHPISVRVWNTSSNPLHCFYFPFFSLVSLKRLSQR